MTTSRTAFPLSLDLDAIHAAFRAEGFKDITTDRDREVHQRTYRHDGIFLIVTVPTATSTLANAQIVECAHERLTEALDALIEAFGNPHYECGPRNARERAMLESLNRCVPADCADDA